MVLHRRSAWYLTSFAVWNAYVWVTFVWNVFPQHHWDAFFVVHFAIGAFTTALGAGVGLIGVRALRHGRSSRPESH